MKNFYSSLIAVLFFLLAGNSQAKAATDTLHAGSFIINMGVVPQTIENGLKPYGLVYALVKDHKVPVKWVVNSGKSKDGIDFTHNGIQYRGGTFIVPFEFRTPAVNAEISAWQALGVVGNTSVSNLVLEVTKTIYYAPNWTMDKQNGMIVTSYFSNAGIPASAYGGDSANWKNPSQLNACDDIFVLPHADPTWGNHKNLYYWNQDHKGNLWVACHAVSELENMKDPVTGVQLNFLSTNGLVHWSLHKKDASPAYTYQDHGNPIMQFMGIMDQATNIGSEKTYLPKIGSSWRPSTTVGVYDPTNTFIPLLSVGPAAIVAYGRAYGDANRGYVMYEAGHDHNSNGSVAEKVAAQRAFFNFSFYVAVDRYASFEPTIYGLPGVILGNQAYHLSFNVPPGIDLNNYTVTWTSTSGGTFTTTGDQQTIIFTAPASVSATIVTVTITDGCGREIFSSGGAYIGGILPVATQLTGSYQSADGSVHLKWSENNNESVSHYEIQRADNNNGFKTIALFFPEEKSGRVSYRFSDKKVPEGNNKYRLKVNNTAKTVSYTNTVKITTADGANPGLTVLGNPTRGAVAFEYQSPNPGNIMAVLMDINGRIIGSRTQTIQKGTGIVQMGEFSDQPAGIYLLKVVAGSRTIISRVNFVK